ncbi:sodium channel protein Nach-like [Pararge aegeria]|uniref:sodium channel protein Nach-like n=1 Tax=Pararge aegeria TaxID=116150 RepID=UPI0019D1B557|nr:sodium channel protein Nach-like [Pararge aegeria]
MKFIHAKLNVLLQRLKYTCKNLSVHGPSYLARKDVHLVCRIIYCIIYVQVWVVAVASIYKYISSYQEDTIRFTTQTDYLDWNTTVPSVTVCEIANLDEILVKLQKLDKQSSETIVSFAKDIAFYTGECPSCSLVNNFTIHNFSNYSSAFRSECKDLFISCTWNDKPLNCCQHFKPIQTEYGRCYSINNNQIGLIQSPYYAASSNARKLGTLELNLAQDFEAFLHSPEDVPYWNMELDRRISVLHGTEGSILFSVVDILNEPELSFIPPDVRQCRFPDESPDNIKGYHRYSYSVCIINCRIEAQIELCNCTSHLSPDEYKERYCDVRGLQCLTKHHATLKNLKVPGMNETGLNCDCLSSCVEPEYNTVAKKLIDCESNLKARKVKLILSNRPYERVARQVARTGLDLLVAMGNCFGLGFGGSLLSIVEVCYYVCFKQWRYTNVK